MSYNTTMIIRETRKKIEKLEKDFKRGVNPLEGFTIDLSYGGNKHSDIERITIGSIASPEGSGQALYDLVLSNLKASLKYWEDVARRQISELTIVLAEQSTTNK